MALKTKLIEYKIKDEDLWCSEQFINITIANKGGFTTEEVHNRPIVADDGTGKVIGMLLEADEDNLYGYVTLDGEIVYEPCFNEIYIPTDDGYFVDPSTSKVYDKNMEQIIKDDTWKTIVLISSGSKY